MYPEIEELQKVLKKENYISDEDDKLARKSSKNSKEYISYLLSQEIISKPLLGQALAEYYKTPYVSLENNPPRKDTIGNLPEDIASKQRLIFVKSNDKVVALASDKPNDVDKPSLVESFKNKTVRIAYALPEYIDLALALYDKPLDTRFAKIISEGERVAPEIVDEIISDSVSFKASDIHFEPHVDDVVVRFRYDGSLREAGRIPKEYYENILNRIKVESGMRIDDHFSAQDGSIRRNLENKAIDFRVSLVPTVNGEKVVMRVLGSYIQDYTLSDIGLSENHRKILQQYSQKPFGMILTCGPTGAGKTTTLYSILKILNKPDANITTIEDPVEYKIENVNQIQVRESSNLTFAKGLRSIVRQDPDVILVGEIRDDETGEISVNAALTGHLLLSTFHANDAATSIPRLIDMGTEPFLLSSTLELVIAQRLVRKICPHCKHSITSEKSLGAFDAKSQNEVRPYFDKTITLYEGKGCNACNDTGYIGRTALFEFIEITPEMKEIILSSPSVAEIINQANKDGFVSMFDDGVSKVKSGLTTLSEVTRVVEPPKKKLEHAKKEFRQN